jgi:hypothetical protein
MRDQRSTGEVVTETFDYDGRRPVTVYVPADPPEAVVFASDGQLISEWGGDLEAADVPSTMIVGVHRLADETLRLQEYSPGTSAAGRGRDSESRCPPSAPRCSVSRRAGRWRSRSGSGIQRSTVRSSAPRRAPVT